MQSYDDTRPRRSNPAPISNERFRGAVKWFDENKGFGFIVPDAVTGRQDDIFFHVSEVHNAGLKPADIYEGMRLEFSQTLKAGKKKPEACVIKRLD